jgi:hypothetical protein
LTIPSAASSPTSPYVTTLHPVTLELTQFRILGAASGTQ